MCGLFAKDPHSGISVHQHVSFGSGWQHRSQYISTCGSLKAVLTFNMGKPNPTIVKIWEKNLPVANIDLRILEIRMCHNIFGPYGLWI